MSLVTKDEYYGFHMLVTNDKHMDIYIWKRIRVELARLGYDAWVYVDREIFAAYHDLRLLIAFMQKSTNITRRCIVTFLFS